MKRLALYKEIVTPHLSKGASIVDNMNFLTKEEATKIEEYLSEKEPVIMFLSKIPDPYNGEDFVYYAYYSDGVYIWDAVIINWVKKYRIRLPDDFLEHLKKLNYKRKENEPIIDPYELFKDCEEFFFSE